MVVTEIMINIQEIQQRIRPIAEQYNIRRLAIFGSYARNEATPNSDIDVLVDLPDEKYSLLDFMRIKLQMEQVLHTKVDLVEYKTIKPRIQDRVLKEQIVLI